jgi:hypothetical protein
MRGSGDDNDSNPYVTKRTGFTRTKAAEAEGKRHEEMLEKLVDINLELSNAVKLMAEETRSLKDTLTKSIASKKRSRDVLEDIYEELADVRILLERKRGGDKKEVAVVKVPASAPDSPVPGGGYQNL